MRLTLEDCAMPKESIENFRDFNLTYVSENRILDYLSSIADLTLPEMETCSIKLTKSDFNLLKKLLYNNRKTLSEMQEKIVYQRFWKYKSIREIASSLNVSQGTVFSHLYRAKQKIKNSITCP